MAPSLTLSGPWGALHGTAATSRPDQRRPSDPPAEPAAPSQGRRLFPRNLSSGRNACIGGASRPIWRTAPSFHLHLLSAHAWNLLRTAPAAKRRDFPLLSRR